MKFEPAGLVKRRAQIKTSGGGDYNVRIKRFNSKNNTLNCKEAMFSNTTYIDADKIVSIKPKSLLLEIIIVILALIGLLIVINSYINTKIDYNKWYNIRSHHQTNIRYDEL